MTQSYAGGGRRPSFQSMQFDHGITVQAGARLSSRSLGAVGLLAMSVGGAAALLTGQGLAVSIRLWLGGLAFWFVGAVVRRLLSYVPLEDRGLQPLTKVKRQTEETGPKQLREIRSAEVLLLRSSDNDRAFRQQLRPRLQQLAAHYVPMRHGIDPAVDPHAARQALGHVGWMIDDSVTGRSPSLADVEAFLIELGLDPARPNDEAKEHSA